MTQIIADSQISKNNFRRAKPAHFAFCIVRHSSTVAIYRRQIVFAKVILSLLILLLFSGCIPRGVEEPVDVRRFQESQADSLMTLGRYWEALVFYRHAWMLSATDEERAEISAKLYRVFYDAREWDSCVVQAEALRQTPWFDSLPQKGLVYWRAGRFEGVLGITDASPLLRAEAALRLGLEDSARVLYAEAEDALGEAAQGRMAEVEVHMGNTDEAITLLTGMKHPSNSQVRLLVELLFERQAWVDLPAAIAMLPGSQERLSALVRLYSATGDEGKKRRIQMQLIREAPGSRTAQEAAREIEPKDADETFALAKVYAGIDKEKALSLFEEAQNRGYSSVACRWEKGQIYYNQKKYEDAYKELKELKSTQGRFLYVKAALGLGRTSEAMKVLEDMAQNAASKSDRQEAWERMATILQEQKKNREAAQLAEEGARVLEDAELGHRALILWLVEGDTAKARAALADDIPIDSDIALFFRVWLSPDSTDLLLSQLEANDPFSYYSLTARGKLDGTPSLENWFIELGDTSYAISPTDSIIEGQAWDLAEAGFFAEASSKLKSIKDPPMSVRVGWAKRFSELGADNIAIDWVERILVDARKKGVRTRPLEVLRVQYPAVYLFKIYEQSDDPVLFLSLTRQESWFNPYAKSPANAYGLCQLLYSTARAMDTTVTVDSLYLPGVSVRLGAEFLRTMQERFDDREVAYIAAYNAGPGAVKRWLEYLPADDVLFIELIPYDETRNYVKQILRGEVIYSSLLGSSKG